MKKNSAKGYVILSILFIVISVIVFAVPIEKTMAVWIVYGFTAVAFVAQIWIWNRALGGDKTLKSKFFGLPVLQLGIGYLLLHLAVLAVFLLIPTLPVWGAVVICVLLGGIFAVLMLTADVGRGEIERVEEKVAKKVSCLRELQSDIEVLADNEFNADIKSALIQLAEKIRFSAPMSCEQTAEIEKKISVKVAELKTAEQKAELVTELTSLLNERNAKCKILK